MSSKMTAATISIGKHELEEYLNLVREAAELEEDIKDLETRSQARFWTEGRRSSFGTDRIGNLVAKIVELQSLLERKQADILQRRLLVERAIEELEPGDRRLIRLRYVRGLAWNEVAEELGYCTRQVIRIHQQVLHKMSTNVA